MVFLLLLAIMLTLVFPIDLQAAAAQKNAITELGIKKLPEGSVMKVGETYNFDPKILKTERGKGKTTGVVWWEVGQICAIIRADCPGKILEKPEKRRF